MPNPPNPWELTEEEALMALHEAAIADSEESSWVITSRATVQKFWRWLNEICDEHSLFFTRSRYNCGACRAALEATYE